MGLQKCLLGFMVSIAHFGVYIKELGLPRPNPSGLTLQIGFLDSIHLWKILGMGFGPFCPLSLHGFTKKFPYGLA